jgi:F-type H+-transporting ATPase subunit b
MRARLILASAALLLSAAGPEKEGMPQLNFATPLTISQVVWGAIIFVLLYLLLSRWALPKVAVVVEARHATVAGDLETARAEAAAAVASATLAAKSEAAEQAARMNASLDAQLTEAEGRIGQARAAAMGALRQVANEAATAVVTRLTGHAPQAGAVDHAVGDLLIARGQG